MEVIVDLCVVPIGVGVHLTPSIAACEQVQTEAGLKIQRHPIGCNRVYTTVTINTRNDKNQSLEDKVASVQTLLCCQATENVRQRFWSFGSCRAGRASGSPRTRSLIRSCGTGFWI